MARIQPDPGQARHRQRISGPLRAELRPRVRGQAAPGPRISPRSPSPWRVFSQSRGEYAGTSASQDLFCQCSGHEREARQCWGEYAGA
eukprot:11106306-Alexandrium_andersonii.AAC.1